MIARGWINPGDQHAIRKKTLYNGYFETFTDVQSECEAFLVTVPDTPASYVRC